MRNGERMNLFLTGIIAGVFGTFIMDFLNHLFARAGLLSKIDIGMIGRMSSGWMHGRIRYRHPSEMKQVTNEKFYGYITHYLIGVLFALVYVISWYYLMGRPISPLWALAYGIATTVGSLFLIYPSMGLGMLGRRSSEVIKSPLSSLANHTFYGIGLAIGIALI
jgi:hypothetical protein